MRANKLAKEKDKLVQDLADTTDHMHAAKDGLGPLEKVCILACIHTYMRIYITIDSFSSLSC